ncbi:alpha/beta fold hydrolase [Leucobacter soli]|uniref:Tropinesterase n=1 Tax=Leucobacter soli TaxID=2812850 RepID=A0A916JZQ7_9MICO|nr:alpha/beta hydrolase [Leucobacter soli]CAG7610974.1 Tropinesterase [Leucobacter soli]
MAGTDRTYERDRITMAYTETSGPGPLTFVLVHGIGMGRVVFSEVAEILSEQGRVLAVDLPGFGDSPEPGSESTLEETAEVIVGFLQDEAPGPVVLVGHSMGTQIVAEAAYRHPDRVAALVLIAPTVDRHARTATRQALRMVRDLTGEGPKVLLLGLWEYAKTSPIWFVNKLRFMLDHRLELICPGIATPTLVLRGETDRVCPREWVSEIAEALPEARMTEISGRGHEAIIKSPEPVASLILEFVEALPRADRSSRR